MKKNVNPIFTSVQHREAFFKLKQEALDKASKYSDQQRSEIKIIAKAARNELDTAKVTADKLLQLAIKNPQDGHEISYTEQLKEIRRLRHRLSEIIALKNEILAIIPDPETKGKWIHLR